MPKVRTVVKHVTELQPSEVQVLKELNLGCMGRMKGMFGEACRREDGWAVIHYSPEGGIDGWTLMFPDIYGEYPVTGSDLVGYFYVHPESRRQGIGRALMRHARTLSPEPFVVPWNDQSAGFFKACEGVKVDPYNSYAEGLTTLSR